MTLTLKQKLSFFFVVFANFTFDWIQNTKNEEKYFIYSDIIQNFTVI